MILRDGLPLSYIIERGISSYIYKESVCCLDTSLTFYSTAPWEGSDTASYVCICICAVCGRGKTPKLFWDHSESEIMKTFYQEGNISFWQAHLCGSPSTEVLQKKIFGHISYTGLIMPCGYHLKDSLKWSSSLLRIRQHYLVLEETIEIMLSYPLILWMRKVRLRLRSFFKVMQLLNSCPLVSLTNSSRTSGCHNCYLFTWFSIFLYSVLYPFQFVQHTFTENLLCA